MFYISASHYHSRLWSRHRTGPIVWALVPLVISLAPLLALALFVAVGTPTEIEDGPSIAYQIMAIGP